MSDRDRDARGEAAPADNAAEESEEDLRARFPDPEADERLRVPRDGELPPAPQVTFKRPTLPQPGPPGKGPLPTRVTGELRGMGEAATIGITLAASIAVGTGLGWLVDTYLLRSTGTQWGLIVGFLLGTASGFVNLIRVANRLNR